MGCQLLEHALSRSRFRFQIVVTAASSVEILASLRNNQVDVALISQSLQDGPRGGFQLLSELRTTSPRTRIVVLLKAANCELVIDAFRGGAKGVFCRTESFAALCKCILSVYQGQVGRIVISSTVCFELLWRPSRFEWSTTLAAPYSRSAKVMLLHYSRKDSRIRK